MEPPPVPRPVLPTGVKATGWIFLFVGAWNLVCTAAILLSGAEVSGFSRRTTVWISGIFCPWTVLAVVASTGLLLRKEWGRRAAIVMICFLMVVLVAWMVFTYSLLPFPHTTAFEIMWTVLEMVLPCGFMLAALFGLYMLTRYLSSERVRATFAPDTPKSR